MTDPDRRIPRLVRPYALTTGRTQPNLRFGWEATVKRLPRADDLPRPTSAVGNVIVEMTRELISIAEISARVGTPLGVIHVLVADLVATGHVRVMATLEADSSDAVRRDLIERVLSGLQRA
ncbi:DUF742 domain-containing protein [Tsukamurella sp. NPDC003166]|uniref:DUF742 domain-containing protein n=1 Tax=Tsukamurella sp. NPDC003166 TaxID=3154444 RepID=UPI0033BAABBE